MGLSRKKPLRRGQPPRRSGKPIPPRKKDPSKRAFAKHRDPAYSAWIKTLPCLICGRLGVDPAHVIKRSRGAPDRANIVPLCRKHHDEQEAKNAEFEEKYAICLTVEAMELDVQYESERAA